VLLGTSTGCDKLKSRDQINKGVAAFKNGQYEEAVSNFQTAVRLDPSSENAKLYLATSYAYQVVPNLLTPENLAFAQKALDGFNEVLAKSPDDLTALKQVASIDRNIQKFDEAKAYELKVIKVAPDDPEAYYIVGFVDWTLAYKNALAILAADGAPTVNGMTGDPKKSKGACQKLMEQNTDLVTEGLQYLNKAVDLNPKYDDAMSYISLDYRLKAENECGSDADSARKADLALADQWGNKSMGARKANEIEKEKKAATGAVTAQ